MAEPMPLEGFVRASFTDGGKTRETYTIGTGPGVVVIHEIPGITPEVAAFGRRVAGRGLTAVLPVLFGTPGKPQSRGYIAEQSARLCISREFACFAKRRSSPITVWLRALCRDVHRRYGGPGVGVVGMCATGGFALSMMAEPSVLAPVLSQPSLPLPLTGGCRSALGISCDELRQAQKRCAEGVTILGLRFTGDRICPPERFQTLRQKFGDHFEGIEIDSSWCNPYDIPEDAHSVLTVDLIDRQGHPTHDALERVLGMFEQRLLKSP
ncbi:MAG: dienelactone hydrolase family protein [Isosphaeraceae bacterium]